MGFGIDPDATSIAFFNDTTDEFRQATLSAFPAFPDSDLIDITAQTGPGARRTLQAGESDTMLVRLGMENLVTGTNFTISPVNVFIQTDIGSFEFGHPPPTSVAAPMGLPLILLGLLLSAIGYRHSAVRSRSI